MEDKAFGTLADLGMKMVSDKFGIPSDSIILCAKHDDDTAAPRLTRAQWEAASDDQKWRLIWLSHATLESQGIWS